LHPSYVDVLCFKTVAQLNDGLPLPCIILKANPEGQGHALFPHTDIAHNPVANLLAEKKVNGWYDIVLVIGSVEESALV
jgi:hypothetical protein